MILNFKKNTVSVYKTVKTAQLKNTYNTKVLPLFDHNNKTAWPVWEFHCFTLRGQQCIGRKVLRGLAMWTHRVWASVCGSYSVRSAGSVHINTQETDRAFSHLELQSCYRNSPV